MCVLSQETRGPVLPALLNIFSQGLNLVLFCHFVVFFPQSVEKHRLKSLLKERLIECGWRDAIKDEVSLFVTRT